jgi:hypothetical protein
MCFKKQKIIMNNINNYLKLGSLIILLTGCFHNNSISPKNKTFTFKTIDQEHFFPTLHWLSADNEHFYVPELNDCKIFRINTHLEVVDFIDLREQFGPFDLGQVGIYDSLVFAWNRRSNSFYVFTPDLKYIGQHILTHLVEIDKTRIAFSDESFIGSTGKTVSKFSLKSDTIEFDETILYTDTYKPCHYLENNGFLFLISESLPIIEVYKNSKLVNTFDYSLDFPEVITTIENFEKKLKTLGGKAMFYTVVTDVVATNEFIYLLVASKDNPDDYSSNTIISFFVEEGVIKLNRIYKLQDIKVIRSIAVTNGHLLAVGVERPTNSVLIYNLY